MVQVKNWFWLIDSDSYDTSNLHPALPIPPPPHIIANIGCSSFLSQHALWGNFFFFSFIRWFLVLNTRVKSESLDSSFHVTGRPDCKTPPLLIITPLKCCKDCQPNYALSGNTCSQDTNEICSLTLLLRLVMLKLKFSLSVKNFQSMTLYFETGQNCREMKIEISVKSLLLVYPILGHPTKFSMTKGSSTSPRYKEFRNISDVLSVDKNTVLRENKINISYIWINLSKVCWHNERKILQVVCYKLESCYILFHLIWCSKMKQLWFCPLTVG